MKRIVIADDHPIVRIGVATLLANQHGLQICGEAENGPQLLDLVARLHPDVVITDYKMRGEHGVQDGEALIRALRQRYPAIGIIILTVLDSPLVFRLALKRGANAVVFKSADYGELLAAVREIAAGRRYVTKEMAAFLNSGTYGALPLRAERLTLRETEVVRLFVSGCTVSEIADSLQRSKKTISTQKRSAMAKIGAHSDQELLEYARHAGLV